MIVLGVHEILSVNCYCSGKVSVTVHMCVKDEVQKCNTMKVFDVQEIYSVSCHCSSKVPVNVHMCVTDEV